jgi:hypothetical protein
MIKGLCDATVMLKRKKILNHEARKKRLLLKKLKHTNNLSMTSVLQRKLRRLSGNKLAINIKNGYWKTGCCRGFYKLNWKRIRCLFRNKKLA